MVGVSCQHFTTCCQLPTTKSVGLSISPYQRLVEYEGSGILRNDSTIQELRPKGLLLVSRILTKKKHHITVIVGGAVSTILLESQATRHDFDFFNEDLDSLCKSRPQENDTQKSNPQRGLVQQSNDCLPTPRETGRSHRTSTPTEKSCLQGNRPDCLGRPMGFCVLLS